MIAVREILSVCGILTVMAGSLAFGQADPTSAPSGPIPVLSLDFEKDDPALNERVTGNVTLGVEGARPPEYPRFAADNKAARFGGGRLVFPDPGDNSPFDFTLGDTLTIEAWVQVSSLGNGQTAYVVSKGRTGNPGFNADNQSYGLRIAGVGSQGCLSFLFRGAPQEKGVKAEYHRWDSKTGFPLDGGWHHVAVTYTFGDPDSIRGFVDGKQVEGRWPGFGGPSKLGPVVDNDELWIGSSMKGGSGPTFHGAIDNLVISRGAVPAEELLARYERVEPPSYETPDPLPEGKVLVELFYGIPDQAKWNFRIPAPVESYTQDQWATVEVPAAYTARGIRDNRVTPMMMRKSGWVTFEPGPQKLLLRSRTGARLFVDGKLVTENPFAGNSSDGHNEPYVMKSDISDKIRVPRPGDRETAVVIEATGKPQKITVEAIAGGNRRRPEFGELCLCLERSPGEYETVSYTKGIPLTDRDWTAFAFSERDRLQVVNQQRRLKASEQEQAYWDARHEQVLAGLKTQPAIPVPDAPAGRNPVDAFIDAELKKAGESPRKVIDDWAYLRRATLDITGRIPTRQDIQAYFADPVETRRTLLVDRLLESPEWADHWTSYWQDVLAENPNIINPTLNNTGPFRWWIHESFLDNKPFDRFVTELVLMEGSERYGGTAGFAVASQNDAPNAAKAGILAAGFLGMNMKCARCHDAPYHDFTQKDLFNLAALIKRGNESVPKSSTVTVAEGARPPLIKITLKPGEVITPEWPFADRIPKELPAGFVRSEKDTREHLAAWLTSPANTRFHEVIVNRLWHRYFGKGLVDVVDDWEHATPSHPELLAWLSRELMQSGYDLKHLVRLILTSEAYQREVESDAAKARLLVGPTARRMTAEQLIDSMFTACGKPFNTEELSVDLDGARNENTSITLGIPRRAWHFVSLSNERDRPSLSLPAAQTFIDVLEAFGWRAARQDSQTIRSSESSPIQPAILENGVVGRRVVGLSDDSLLTAAALESADVDEFIDRVSQMILTRPATARERTLFAAVLSDGYSERVIAEAPICLPGPPREMGVTWANHLKPIVNEYKVQIAREVEQGDPPTARLNADWRERAEDVIWTILNSPEFMFVP